MLLLKPYPLFLIHCHSENQQLFWLYNELRNIFHPNTKKGKNLCKLRWLGVVSIKVVHFSPTERNWNRSSRISNPRTCHNNTRNSTIMHKSSCHSWLLLIRNSILHNKKDPVYVSLRKVLVNDAAIEQQETSRLKISLKCLYNQTTFDAACDHRDIRNQREREILLQQIYMYSNCHVKSQVTLARWKVILLLETSLPTVYKVAAAPGIYGAHEYAKFTWSVFISGLWIHLQRRIISRLE